MSDRQPRLALVGTHHKTGTVWMRRVFNFTTDKLGMPRIRINGAETEAQIPAEGRAVLVSWVSNFSDALLDRSDARGLHLIRDPRDVLISGARYHQIAPEAGEKALHVPQNRFGGKSYQGLMKGMERDHDKLVFEMENIHLDTLAQMTAWRYDRPNIREVRYEDLMLDTDCAMFGDILDFLGFAGDEKEVALQCYWDNSLFGGFKEKDDRPRRVSLHIQSGEIAQWTRRLPRSVAEIYADRHGDALIALGYETDTSWVDRCPVTAPPLSPNS